MDSTISPTEWPSVCDINVFLLVCSAHYCRFMHIMTGSCRDPRISGAGIVSIMILRCFLAKASPLLPASPGVSAQQSPSSATSYPTNSVSGDSTSASFTAV